MRLAVYTDDVYRRDDRGLWATEAFALFLARIAGFVDGLVLVGRLDPVPASGHHLLEGDLELAELPYHAGLASPGALIGFPRSLVRFWRALAGVDAVWLLGPHPLALLFALLATLRGRRVVLGVRQNMPEYVRTRHPGRPLVQAAGLALETAWRTAALVLPVVVVGPDLARRYRASRSLLDMPVSLIEEEDLADPAVVAARDYDGELVALAVGRLDPEKNPLLLADVLARVRAEEPRWRLVVCGDGSLRSDLETRLAELGQTDFADLLGYVPLDDGLRERYRSSHALLHVSWTEGFPQVLIEAFAAGLPAVATDVGGVAALAAGAARLVPPGDADAAAEELLLVGRDAAERRRLIGLGLDRAAQHTASVSCRRLVAFIDSPRVARSREPAAVA